MLKVKMMSKVYISYSRKDESFVHALHAKLEAAEVETWVDWRDIPAGYPWRQALFDGLAACDTILMVLSPNFVDSETCRMEAFLARSYAKRLVPIMLDDCYDLLLKFPELRGLGDLQNVPYCTKHISGYPLSEEALFKMVLGAIKGEFRAIQANLIYFSYQSSAAVYATELATTLHEAGFPTWIGTLDHHVGADWQEEQWAAMMKARAFLIMLNEYTAQSEHIRRQILFARTRRLPMIPVVVPSTKLDTLSESLAVTWEMRLISEIQWLIPEPNPDAMLENLKEMLNKLLAQTSQ